MGSPAPISQMVKLRLDEGEGLGPDLTAQKWPSGDLNLSRLSRGQKPPHFGVPSLLKASVSLGERGGLEEVTSKIVSRCDLCCSQGVTVNPPGRAIVIQAALASGAPPSSWASWSKRHLVFSPLGCPKVKVVAPGSHPHSLRACSCRNQSGRAAGRLTGAPAWAWMP